jgi:hypothetical protein
MSPGTVSGSTITLTDNNSIYTDSYSTNGTINTSSIGDSTITVNSGYSPMAGDSIWLDDTPSNIKLGGQTLNEETIEKLTALLDVLEGMEGTELAAMLETQILLNKVKNGNT